MSDLGSILSPMPDILRLAISAVLILSGFSKLLDTTDFTRVLRRFHALPSRAARPFAVFIPVLEFAVGSWLAFGDRGTNAAAVIGGGLFVIFAAVVAGTLLQGTRLECGCFGRIFGGTRATWLTVGRNAVLTAMAVVVAIRYDDASSHVVTGLPALLVIMAGVIGAILVAEASSAFRAESARHRVGPGSANADADSRPQPLWTPKGADEWMGSG